MSSFAGIVEAGEVIDTSSLLSVPMEVTGDWEGMIPNSALAVVQRMRQACLEGISLFSDRQPTRLRVEERDTGQPAIWLHNDEPRIGWIIVDIGTRDWSKLAYQFGHELGHVMANSWQRHAVPALPCQWLEEAIVEACSLRGLGRLAANWKTDPPFPNDNKFSEHLFAYRDKIVAKYEAIAADQGGISKFGEWFGRHRNEIEASNGLSLYAQAATLFFLKEYDSEIRSIESIGALNRWPGRSGVALAEYITLWEASCTELGAHPHLPQMIKKELQEAHGTETIPYGKR